MRRILIVFSLTASLAGSPAPFLNFLSSLWNATGAQLDPNDAPAPQNDEGSRLDPDGAPAPQADEGASLDPDG